MSKLKHSYNVYKLIDPRTAQPFYIGIGTGSAAYREPSILPRHTKLVIDQIRTESHAPKIEIIEGSLASDDALKLQNTFIQKYGRIGYELNGILTNKVIQTDKIKKRKQEYATIQVYKNVHDQIVDYCNTNNLKIGQLMSEIFLTYVSGSKNANS